MKDILNEIIGTKRREVVLADRKYPYEKIREEASEFLWRPPSFRKALSDSSSGIIAEFKRRSPSKGAIHASADPAVVVPGYAKSGAAAVSVLTDRTYFGGSLSDLGVVSRLVSLPLLRKDFVIDRYQICEARMSGAAAVLLIAAAMTPEQAYELACFARLLGLEVLLEIHGKEELIYLNEYVDVVGVNNRNLKTFITDVHTSFDLSDDIPDGYLKISESGLSSPEIVRQLRKAGYRGFLMGEHFMKHPDPAEQLKFFIEAL